MKIKIFLLALGVAMGTLGAYAQKGVDNGTQYGSGEDSIRCITNISLYVPYAKAGNYKDAAEFWKIVYDECPASGRDVYLYGVRIVNWQISQEQDAAKRTELINFLMDVYDKRVKYFGDDPRYPKDWIVARKAQDYISLLGDNADNNMLYGWLKEVVDEKGENCDPLAVSLYVFTSLRLMNANDNLKPQYIDDYFKATAIYDTQIKAAEAAGSETTAISYKQAIDGQFIASGAADCETLQNMYAPKIEENKTNLEFLQETLSIFRRLRCQESEAYFAASRYAHVIAPTAESAVGLGKQAVRDKDYNLAITYFEEAANLETDPNSKADDYYMIALLLQDQNSYSRARQYAQKALEYNPNYGKAYILIGQMYAATARSIYPNDGVLVKVVYNVAIDKFEQARRVDPESADDANRLISTFRAHLPSTEEIFMHPELEKGASFTVGGWINERTTIR